MNQTGHVSGDKNDDDDRETYDLMIKRSSVSRSRRCHNENRDRGSWEYFVFIANVRCCFPQYCILSLHTIIASSFTHTHNTTQLSFHDVCQSRALLHSIRDEARDSSPLYLAGTCFDNNDKVTVVNML